MAKKNSSKTATEKAISSSEPRVLSFKGWQGVNFVDSPLTWEPLESPSPQKFNQTDLPANFFMVQNNLNTTPTLGVETRMDSIEIADVPEGFKWTGIATIYKHWVFLVARSTASSWYERIYYRDLLVPESSWTALNLRVGSTDSPTLYEIAEIGFFEGNMVATVRNYNDNPDSGLLALASVSVNEAETTITIKGMDWSTHTATLTDTIVDTPKISPTTDRPGVTPVITAVGQSSGNSVSDSTPVRVEVKYCYTNRLGSTLTQTDANCATKYVEYSPTLWTTGRYVRITPSGGDSVAHETVDGIDFYGRDTENLDWVFIGHINVTPAQVTNGSWSYNWYGNMTDISQWLTSQLMVPTDNTTHGPDASHFDTHDSRMYFWGMPSKPYRLWIGGNPGSEFSIARGLGGAWVDIEPGSGYDVMGTAKWKTTSGSNIVTIMCGNRNTTKIKRFNLVETNLTLTNEVAYKSYMYEEVSNVVGCNSRYGYGVYTDGLYALNRYGLMLTTMAAEYNNQMKNQKVSDAIDPIFTERIGKRLRDGRMVCINEVIYIALSEDEDGWSGGVVGLDNVILCYDIGLKAWYTWTHDQTLDKEYGGGTDKDPDKILHIFAIDSDEYREGLGVITDTELRLYPVTGVQDPNVPLFQVLLESGELTPRMPKQAFWYVQQLELRFDYYVGDPEDPATVLVEGVDYYGRYFKVEKKLNYKQRTWQDVNDNAQIGERRNHVEWIRVDKLVESFRVRIKGKARFRLTHVNANVYQQSDTIGTPYGFDAHDDGVDSRGKQFEIHHYIDDYNNLRRAVVS